MFGNKNSAVPYVRIGGVDRQSVLTSNANGNTPVREIGVDADGNLLYSTDYANYTKVKSIDLKYSKFVPYDNGKIDYWELNNGGTAIGLVALNEETKEQGLMQVTTGAVDILGVTGNSISQIQASSSTLYLTHNIQSETEETIGNAELMLNGESGLSLDYANGNDKSSSIKIENNVVTLKASETASDNTTQSSSVSVAKDGVTIAGKLTLPNSVIQEDSLIDGGEEWTNATGIKMHTKSTTHDNNIFASNEGVLIGSQNLSTGTPTAPVVTNIGVSGDTTTIQSRNGNTIRSVKFTPTSTTIDNKEIATTDKLPNLDNYLDLTKRTAQSVAGQIIFNNINVNFSQGISNKSGDNIAGVLANHMTFGATNFTARILGNTVRPKYATVYSTSASDLQDLALLSDVPTALSQLSGDTTHRVVTDTEKATWNAKSNFDGDYNSLTNPPTIPTKTSQLTNDSSFATTSQIPTFEYDEATKTLNIITG